MNLLEDGKAQLRAVEDFFDALGAQTDRLAVAASTSIGPDQSGMNNEKNQETALA